MKKYQILFLSFCHFLLCVSFITLDAFAENLAHRKGSYIHQSVSDLIADHIANKDLTVEIFFNSNIDNIDNNLHNIKDILLEKFNPQYDNFTAKIIYKDNSTDLISGRYFLFTEVPVATRFIRFNEILQSSDITTVSVRIDSLKQGIISDINSVIGKKAKKQISAGGMFHFSDLMQQPVININDPVNIVYSSGLINLKTTGISLGSGVVGDTIKVKNESSGNIILGEIINKNTVKVGGDSR